MKELKPMDYRLFWELVKNSRRSDRKLAKVLGVSQPTVTRKRAKLEEDFIDGYTVIPKWGNIGYELTAFTFVRTKIRFTKPEERVVAIQKANECLINSQMLSLSQKDKEWDGGYMYFISQRLFRLCRFHKKA